MTIFQQDLDTGTINRWDVRLRSDDTYENGWWSDIRGSDWKGFWVLKNQTNFQFLKIRLIWVLKTSIRWKMIWVLGLCTESQSCIYRSDDIYENEWLSDILRHSKYHQWTIPEKTFLTSHDQFSSISFSFSLEKVSIYSVKGFLEVNET